MKDVQSQKDTRGIEIQKVGVKNVSLPFLIKEKGDGFQQVLANICFTVSLPMQYKGTHMSRFLEILEPWSKKPIAEVEMEKILDDAMEYLDAKSANIKIDFTYFIEKIAPVSKEHSLLNIYSFFEGEKKINGHFDFTLGIKVPFTSLCPCSKEISKYGAHNQRSLCSVKVRFKEGFQCIFIEDLTELLEQEGSSPIYSLLKREDEKFVTEKAYENPKFVEDVLRDDVIALRNLEGISYFSLDIENFESIHNHNAYASHEEWVNE